LTTRLAELMDAPQYTLDRTRKDPALLECLNALTAHHAASCPPYATLLSTVSGRLRADRLEDVPYLPVGLFKSHELMSIPRDAIFKTLTSSGTTGQQVSQVFLDVRTAELQTKALSTIMQRILGPVRLPMLLVESAALIRDRRRFSARAAGVLGMATFGRNHFYCLDEGMELDEPGLRAFLDRFKGQPIRIFGFTFMVWQYFYNRLRGQGIDLSNGILLHSGGWKKLQEQAVSNQVFRQRLHDETGLHRIYNFYGMVEQVGSVFVEGEDGFLYPPNFADVIVRDPVTWDPAPPGQPGIIQVLSALPHSYPGHSILTEDLGIIYGTDDSTCGRMGRRFAVLGRVPKSELRGCSDVQAASQQALG